MDEHGSSRLVSILIHIHLKTYGIDPFMQWQAWKQQAFSTGHQSRLNLDMHHDAFIPPSAAQASK